MKSLTLKNILWKLTETGVFYMALVPGMAHAADCDPASGSISEGATCAKSNSNVDSIFGDGGVFQKISNILIFLIGAVAVIMLIVGGFQYVISGGDKGRVESAKNTILYAVIGIVVAILAYAIVGFVTGSLAPTTT